MAEPLNIAEKKRKTDIENKGSTRVREVEVRADSKSIAKETERAPVSVADKWAALVSKSPERSGSKASPVKVAIPEVAGRQRIKEQVSELAR